MVAPGYNYYLFIVQVSTEDGVEPNIDEPMRVPLEHQQKQKVMGFFFKYDCYDKVSLKLMSPNLVCI